MIATVTPAMRLLSRVSAAIVPREHVSTWEWANQHGRMPDGTPFDGDRIPWARGVFDALDDPETRMVSLQWGTRLGKTTIGLQWVAKVAATKPRPGLFATSTQSLAERTVRNKFYPMLAACEKTAPLLPHERWWKVSEIRLSSSPWAVAWSGSDTQLADLSAVYGYANEIDKWSMSERMEGEAGEGDPFDQFLERFKEFHNHTILCECSPSTKSRSRIEKQRLAGTNSRYYVPCPKCGEHQVLRMGKKGEPGGVRWDKHADGTSDPVLARKTARYECERCQFEIDNDRRQWMMLRGVWAPEGCAVDKSGRLTGTPLRSARFWSSQLSSLYSLQLRWGDVAEKFLRTRTDPRSLRMFVNGWVAETWEPYRSKSEPEQVGERLTVTTPRGVIPRWATHLFAAIDQQQSHFVCWIVACDAHEREHLVDHFTVESLVEVESRVVRQEFAHEDGGAPLRPAATAIDCGFRTKDVYAFCQKFRGTGLVVIPVKGANTDCGGEAYERKVIGLNEGQSVRTKKVLIRAGRGLVRLRINPFYYEPITQEQLDTREPGQEGSLTLHAECKDDLDLLRQLCNGVESAEPSKSDASRHLWVKRWEKEPNDYRDCKKYARAMMDYHFRKGGWSVAKKRQGAYRAIVNAPVADDSRERRERSRERFRPELGAGRRER
jgi:phage terminase large subunit GpA-like protein